MKILGGGSGRSTTCSELMELQSGTFGESVTETSALLLDRLQLWLTHQCQRCRGSGAEPEWTDITNAPFTESVCNGEEVRNHDGVSTLSFSMLFKARSYQLAR